MLRRYKSQVKSILRALGLRQGRPPWVVAEDQPDRPDPLDEFALYGLVVTWMEGDVIEATVRNAFAQGCDRVFLVDNGSPDDTVAQAQKAGAELALAYETEQHDEQLKIRLLNEQVARLSPEADREHVWWMWLDADEFVHGPGGRTVREVLAGLDRRFRVVGSRYVNHFPDGEPAALPGFHPLDLQPLAEEKAGNMCPLGHRKHHLQRWDRSGPTVTSGVGFHAATADVTLVEPTISCWTHHFPYRAEAATRARMDALCGADGQGRARTSLHDSRIRRNRGMVSDMTRRYRVLDDVYAGRWERVDRLDSLATGTGVNPRPWDRLADAADVPSARWYTPDELEAARAAWRQGAAAGP
ncbi:MAG TPA: glycosyltransferase family 2 protein [Acidimicrobiales bacterium]